MLEPLTGDAYWALLERTARRVDAWPDWKKGERSTRMAQRTIEVPVPQLSLDVRVLPDIVWAKALHDHWLSDIERVLGKGSSVYRIAHCYCGWNSGTQVSIYVAVDVWIQHVREKL